MQQPRMDQKDHGRPCGGIDVVELCNNPAVDMGAEIFCSLSKRPGDTLLCDLVDDFGLTNQEQLRQILTELCGKTRVRIVVMQMPDAVNEGRRFCTWIDMRDWQRAKQIAQRYWTTTHHHPNHHQQHPNDDHPKDTNTSTQGAAA